jgi:hypothetical protein
VKAPIPKIKTAQSGKLICQMGNWRVPLDLADGTESDFPLGDRTGVRLSVSGNGIGVLDCCQFGRLKVVGNLLILHLNDF